MIGRARIRYGLDRFDHCDMLTRERVLPSAPEHVFLVPVVGLQRCIDMRCIVSEGNHDIAVGHVDRNMLFFVAVTQALVVIEQNLFALMNGVNDTKDAIGRLPCVLDVTLG